MSDSVYRGVTASGVRRVAAFVAAAGVVLAVLFGSALPSAASTGQPPALKQSERAALQQSGETQAFVVGGFAFVLMIGAAGAVLWFTAKSRNHSHH